MMHTYTIASLSNLPIGRDNPYCRVDRYGMDRSADYDVYVLIGGHWDWVGYAWSAAKAKWLARETSYSEFSATRVIGNDDEFFYAYGKEVRA